MLRRDNTIIPQPGAREHGIALPLNPILQLRIRLGADRLHHLGQLLTTHDTDPGIRPHPQEPGAISPSAHAVVARAVAASHNDGELGHVGAGHGRDQLGAVLGDSLALGVAADHETGDVLEEDQGNTALRAELNEVRALQSGRAEEDAVVGHDADAVAVDLGETSDQRGAVVALKLGEGGAVDDARDDLVDGQRLAQVGGGDAQELVGGVERFLELLLKVGRGDGAGGGAARPVEVGDATSGEHDGVRVVDGEVIGHTGDGGVHGAAAELFGADNLASGGLDERWAGKEDVALLLDDDALVGHGGDVGATGGAGAHDHGDLRDALG